jgi:hypothetical protein
MYGLPQAGIIAQELLEEQLKKAGYTQSKFTPGQWKHEWHPISFTLVVDNFEVKYIGKEQVMHLIRVLNEHYKLKKTGKERDTWESPWTGTTRTTKYTYLCPSMWNVH